MGGLSPTPLKRKRSRIPLGVAAIFIRYTSPFFIGGLSLITLKYERKHSLLDLHPFHLLTSTGSDPPYDEGAEVGGLDGNVLVGVAAEKGLPAFAFLLKINTKIFGRDAFVRTN